MNICIEHSLGILCRCKEYKNVVETLNIFKTRIINPYLPKFSTDLPSMKIVWVLRKTETNVNPTKPVIEYFIKEANKIDSCLSETEIQKWIPQNNLFSPKKLPENLSFHHQGDLTTGSTEINTLTDMLPHRGHPVKRKDIDWSVGSHLTPVEMTDEPETKFRSVKGWP
ncbi:uncharacterized protein LOC117182602 isoform X2 [Belonocnema kinseyi]|uniref:uncharacterized protein LOC117182602 isoform X2 n=1 Tax=Belonocnema kinseyi TaxID=2817044 RepID=UPI00143D37AD|nr:uncharacterized protein LOC117182602 isoform X2 [Belonocnema kinseyi]